MGIVLSQSAEYVAPHGSAEAIYGTNPVAFGIPRQVMVERMARVMFAADTLHHPDGLPRLLQTLLYIPAGAWPVIDHCCFLLPPQLAISSQPT